MGNAGGGWDRLDASAALIHPALGAWHCEQRVVSMGPSDRVLVYTDGLIEARRSDTDEMFGIERLESWLDRAPGGGAAELVRALREELAAYLAGRPLEDDLTLVAAGLSD